MNKRDIAPCVEGMGKGSGSEPHGKHKHNRFDFNITSDDMSKFMEGNTPANTEKSTTWSVKNFEEW